MESPKIIKYALKNCKIKKYALKSKNHKICKNMH